MKEESSTKNWTKNRRKSVSEGRVTNCIADDWKGTTRVGYVYTVRSLLLHYIGVLIFFVFLFFFNCTQVPSKTLLPPPNHHHTKFLPPRRMENHVQPSFLLSKTEIWDIFFGSLFEPARASRRRVDGSDWHSGCWLRRARGSDDGGRRRCWLGSPHWSRH